MRLSSRSTWRKKPGAALDLGAVLAVVGALLVREDVAEGGVGGQVQAADLEVDVGDGREHAGAVDVGLDVDGLEAVGEAAGLLDPVVLLDVLARAGDGEQVEEGEVVEAEHVDEARGRSFGFVEGEPAVELLLGQAGGAVDAADAVVEEGGVVALGDEGDLVAQVGQPVVHRCGGEHEHPGLDAFADDPAHEAVVAGLAALLRGALVAEVVRLVDDDEVVVPPVHVGEVDVAREPAVPGEVGVVEDVVVEAVRGEEVAAVVRAVERPVVAQALGAEHEDAVVAQLVVLDDGQRLEGLPEADAVGDDAAAVAVELVDGADDPIALELVELAPDDGVADAGSGLDHLLLVQLVAAITEEVVEGEGVDEKRGPVRGEGFERGEELGRAVGAAGESLPLSLEPLAQQRRLVGGLGGLDEAEGVAGRKAEALGAEGQ